jgi:hypothetical protein
MAGATGATVFPPAACQELGRLQGEAMSEPPWPESPGYGPPQPPYGAQQPPYGAQQPPYWAPQPPYGQQWPMPPQGPPGADPLISPDYSGWWQRATAVVRSSWRQLVALQAILAVVTFGIQGAAGVVSALTVRDIRRAADADEQPPLGDFFTNFGLILGAVLLATLLSTLITLAAVHVVVTTATGGPPRVASCLAAAARRLFPMLGWGIVAGLITAAGVCACVLPAIYLHAVFVVLAPVVALERDNPISRCFRLFHGDLGASVARVATIVGIGIGGWLLGALVGAIGGSITDAETATTAALVTSQLIGSAVAVAISGVLRVLTDPLTVTAYADMRARIEPLSSGVLAQELGRP